MRSVPCLSMRMPWIEAIFTCAPPKLIENRVWNTHYRGPILLQVSLSRTDAYYDAAHRFMRSVGIEPPVTPPMCFGRVMGRAHIVDVIPKLRWTDDSYGIVEGEQIAARYGVDPRWWFREPNEKGKFQYGFVLQHVERFEQWPECKGTQNLFKVDAAVVRDVWRPNEHYQALTTEGP